MKRNTLILIVGALLLAMFVLLLFVFQVRTTEVAVVTTFGRATRPITEPGPYFKWPWPIQKAQKFDNQILDLKSKSERVLTPVGYNLFIMVNAGWPITQPDV